jgi:predicted XRE-type DNA-binding protein
MMTEVEFGSANLWADIGREDAEAAFARAELMSRITAILSAEQLSARHRAEMLGVDEFTVSDLMRGKLSKFSLERLIAFLTALDRDVEITVRPRPEGSSRPARVTVTGD